MPRSQSLPPLQCPRPQVKRCSSGNLAPTSSGADIIVYLDVDGVLNTTSQRAARQHLDNELISNLRGILDAVPGSAIVLSSSWRLQPPLMEALEARFAAEGVAAPIGVTAELPLPDRDPATRGDGPNIEAELARLATQRCAEIHASAIARNVRAWIAIDDLDLRPPSQSTLNMGYPPRPPEDLQEAHDGLANRHPRSKATSRLPALPVRRPFTLEERRSMLPQHALAVRLPRRPSVKGPIRAAEKWVDAKHFVHTSEAAGLTRERADFAIGLLRAQLSKYSEQPKTLMKGRACSH